MEAGTNQAGPGRLVDLITYAKSGLLARHVLKLLTLGTPYPAWSLAFWSSLSALALLLVFAVAYGGGDLGYFTAWGLIVTLLAVTVDLAFASRAMRRTADATAVLVGRGWRRRYLMASALATVALVATGLIVDPMTTERRRSRDVVAAEAAQPGRELYDDRFVSGPDGWDTGAGSDGSQTYAMRYTSRGYEISASVGNVWVQAPWRVDRSDIRIDAIATAIGGSGSEDFTEWGVFCRGQASPPIFFAFVVTTNNIIGIEQWNDHDRKAVAQTTVASVPTSLSADCIGGGDRPLVLRLRAGDQTLTYWTRSTGVFPGQVGLLLRTRSPSGGSATFSRLTVSEMIIAR